ncbi:MAG: type II/IV secretion system ATPase subunit [Candidatus Marsarchaeota archaeon]|jgi:flagellar protein FlaI|nr:type II/IV secretion system ATPase subunit [Candidatus Marsarchaeota archaeon]
MDFNNRFIQAMISRFGKTGPERRTEPPGYKISFRFLDDYPANPSLETNSVSIGAREGYTLYSIKAHPEWLKTEKDAEKMKAYLVSFAMESSEEYNIGDASVISSAQELLSEHFGMQKDCVTVKAVAHDTFGYGPIGLLLEDSANIEEIVINGGTSRISIYHQKYGFCVTNLRFVSEDFARHALNKLLESADKELLSENPIVDASTNSGLRIHAQQAPYSSSGLIASIRLAKPERMGVAFILRKGTVNAELLAYLWMAIEAKLNILITGPPASGKTTLLKALMEVIPRYERIVAIEEETGELIMHSNFSNAVYLIGKNNKDISNRGVSDQVVNALRLRPDRIIVGEIRGPEAKDVFFGSNTGVPFVATMHVSGGGINVVSRLESRPMLVDHALVSNMDIAVSMSLNSSLQRVISGISEYMWLSRAEIDVDKAKELFINEVFAQGRISKEELRHSKVITYFAMRKLISPTEAVKEFARRVKFIGLFATTSGTEFQNYVQEYSGFK